MDQQPIFWRIKNQHVANVFYGCFPRNWLSYIVFSAMCFSSHLKATTVNKAP